MSIFSGPAGKGAMREHRATKRREAEERNSRNRAVVLLCSHATTMAFDEHLARCGRAS